MKFSPDQIEEILSKSERTDPAAPCPADEDDEKREIKNMLPQPYKCLKGCI